MRVRVCVLQELQQKRAQRAAEVQQTAEEELEALRRAGKVGRKKSSKSSPTNQLPGSPTDAKAKNTGTTNLQTTNQFLKNILLLSLLWERSSKTFLSQAFSLQSFQQYLL